MQNKLYLAPNKTLPGRAAISISIGESTFFINKGLRGIANAIEESKILLKDSNIIEDAHPIDFASYVNAINFLYAYSTYIFIETSKKKILATPYIDSMMNGDVYLDWKTEKADFLIIFKKDRDISYFYGETKEDKIPFKSGIRNNTAIKLFLVDWLEENLCA